MKKHEGTQYIWYFYKYILLEGNWVENDVIVLYILGNSICSVNLITQTDTAL